jgi:hypothetical protein
MYIPYSEGLRLLGFVILGAAERCAVIGWRMAQERRGASEECEISQLREWTYHIHWMTPMKFILELINREHTTLVNTIVNRLPKEHLNAQTQRWDAKRYKYLNVKVILTR